MLAKRTDNQITLPKAVMQRFSNIELFDVSTDGTSIILRPSNDDDLDPIRDDIAKRGVTEQDIPAAVQWARSSK